MTVARDDGTSIGGYTGRDWIISQDGKWFAYTWPRIHTLAPARCQGVETRPNSLFFDTSCYASMVRQLTYPKGRPCGVALPSSPSINGNRDRSFGETKLARQSFSKLLCHAGQYSSHQVTIEHNQLVSKGKVSCVGSLHPGIAQSQPVWYFGAQTSYKQTNLPSWVENDPVAAGISSNRGTNRRSAPSLLHDLTGCATVLWPRVGLHRNQKSDLIVDRRPPKPILPAWHFRPVTFSWIRIAEKKSPS